MRSLLKVEMDFTCERFMKFHKTFETSMTCGYVFYVVFADTILSKPRRD